MNSDRGFLAYMRRLERETPNRPRIGHSGKLAEEIVDLGQDPYLGFPAEEFTDKDGAVDKHGRKKLRAGVMGLYGAFGPLPLNTTEEAARWQSEGEDGFVALTDMLSARFQQLFFRAWSDSHAISQHDRPDEDRFGIYLSAITGNGSPAFRRHDDFPDSARLPMVSIFGGRVRSAVRLRQILSYYFDMPVEVEEHVPGWLEFEAEDERGMGQGGALGQDLYLGSRVQSVSERVRVHLTLPDADRYRYFLPGQGGHQELTNLIYWYLGHSYDVELSLRLKREAIPPATLGGSSALGWMAALPQSDMRPDELVTVANFQIDPESARPEGTA